LISVEFNAGEIVDALKNALGKVKNSRELLNKVGMTAAEGVRENFAEQGVDGEKWVDNAPATIERKKLSGGKGNYKKDGSLSAKGRRRVASDMILHDSGLLAKSITHKLASDGVLVGTNAQSEKGYNYPAAMHFGAPKANVPARPWLALSQKTKENIVKEVKNYVERRLK
jgi:phage gpG-like protein